MAWCWFLNFKGGTMDLKLKNKKALVLGGSQGIGKAIAKALVSEGVEVVIASRTEESLKKALKEISAKAYVCCDLGKPGDATSAVKKTIELLGGIDILVTNTGGPQKAKFLDVSGEQWLNDFQNLWLSATEALKMAIPQMQKNKYGRILMVTSIAAKEPLPLLTTSNSLRAGLAGLVRSLIPEIARDGITANLLLPGYTNTDRLKELKLQDEQIKKMIPAGRLGEPEELAALACFLASPLAGYITGQSIAVDGGVLKGH